ncbi:hypothetical protein TESG_08465 [Trichophyton tonsurans CBS 112818]|uniref:Uncharacterized protein n=2 Tax=Trichophyton TaxID=5550 RepID=F2PQN5_TRIEC|nr:hypothetical protein TESG_08465 [Trichophyton tonsurans CBS 112818]EGE04203.1 hypothetical protein TEQG_08652 [Trichophyton equinum CBS 127.97]
MNSNASRLRRQRHIKSKDEDEEMRAMHKRRTEQSIRVKQKKTRELNGKGSKVIKKREKRSKLMRRTDADTQDQLV